MTWADARHVLAVRLDAAGDLLMTTPALRALRNARPDRTITVLTSSAGADVGPLVPEIDDVVVYDPPWMKATPPCRTSDVDRAMIDVIRSRRFDAAAIFTVYSQNPLPAAMLCTLAGIPLRLAHCRENPYQLLTDWVRDPEPAQVIRHEVRRQLDLVATVGATTRSERLSVRVPEPARRRARALLHGLGVDDREFILLHPGATAAARRYSADRFVEVGRALTLRTGRVIVVTGGATERDLVEGIRRGIGDGARGTAGELDLAGLAALIAEAPLLIANNSSPVHVAAAVGTPVVDLYALTNPQHTPWQVPHRLLFRDVPCKFCYRSVCPESHHRCLSDVAVDEVVAAALDLLAAMARGDARYPRDPALAGIADSRGGR